MQIKHSSIWIILCSCLLYVSAFSQQYTWKGVRTPVPMQVQDSSGFTSWQWLNPLPQGNGLYTILTLDNLIAIAAGGNGTIMRTQNGGLTWSVVHHTAGTPNTIRKIVAVDSAILIAVGGTYPSNYPVILRSMDNGFTWADYTSYQNIFSGLTDVVFLRPDLGFATEDYGKILKTTDIGASWTIQFDAHSPNYLARIAFKDDSTGFAVGGNNGTPLEGLVIRTTDAGATWATQSIGSSGYHFGVSFADKQRGYLVGWRQGEFGMMLGTIYRTTDGGNSWSLQSETAATSWESIHFSDNNLGIIAGYQDNLSILRTTDGGDTWNAVPTDIKGVAHALSSFSNETWMGAGQGGLIIGSTDEGISWNNLTPAVRNDLNDVCFVNTEIGLALGDRVLIRTTDGGAHWGKVPIDTLAYLRDAVFLDDSTGFAVGGDGKTQGKLFHTTDAGLSWGEQETGTSLLFGISFGNSDTGIAVGLDNALVRTTNGGLEWSSLTGLPIEWAMKVSMVDGSTGFVSGMNAAGDTGRIIKTTNAGESWITVLEDTIRGAFYDVQFTDVSHGIAVGGYGNIVQTTDGGVTWTWRWPYTSEYGCYGIGFADAQTGAVVTTNGKILRTTDGGTNWTEWNSPTATYLTSVNFVPSGSGWVGYAVGQQGNIICSAISPLNPRTWTWSGAEDSSWNNNNNWSPVGIPLPGDSVVIPPATRSPIVDILQQQITIASLNILSGGRLTITDALGRFVVLGDVIISGTLEIRPDANTVIVVGGSWIVSSGSGTQAMEKTLGRSEPFSSQGGFLASQSKVIFTGNGTLSGNFYDLILDTNSVMHSTGNITVENQCTLVDDLDLRIGDVLTLNSPYPEAFAGRGKVTRGSIRRGILQGVTEPYRFESTKSYVQFREGGIYPTRLTVTTYPDSSEVLDTTWVVVPSKIDTLTNTVAADSVKEFSKWRLGVPRTTSVDTCVSRLYVITSTGGNDFNAKLVLRYDQSEVPVGFAEDSLVLLRSFLSSISMSWYLSAGWNIISLPVDVEDARVTVLFPNAVSEAFYYDGAYYEEDTLKKGISYWIKFNESQILYFDGFPLLSEDIPVKEGWNLVGSISDTILTSLIESDPPGIITSNFFEYKGSYVKADTIFPGRGYWVKVSEPGLLMMSSSGIKSSANIIRIVPTSELPPPPPDVVGSKSEEIPIEYNLEQAYPNPFNPSTVIKYHLPFESEVTLRVLNVLGQVVATLCDNNQSAGHKSVEWKASGAASGIYFYRLEATSTSDPGKIFRQVRKMILMK